MNRSRPAIRALLATLLFGFATAGQAASYLHLILVRHQVCPIHGELADVPEGADVPATTSRFESPIFGHQLTDSGVLSVEGSDHHCIASSGRREHAAKTSSAPFALPVAAEARRAIGPQSPRPARLALHRLAPKHSPPPTATA